MSQIDRDTTGEPIKGLVRDILFRGFEQSASDIHIEPFDKLVRVRYRVDGNLEDGPAPIKKIYPNIVTHLKVLSGCTIDMHQLPQRGRFRMRYEAHDIEVHIAFFPTIYGERIVLHIPGQGSMALLLDKLGFEPQPMAALHDALAMTQGLILITGPPGSGKTTTLYSALHKLNQTGVNIMTVEAPVEYEMFGIGQTQVNESIGFTFAEALRQLLFQDPDVVMVGEIQDGETASLAVKAALTGHLVLSVLHADDAAGVFTKLTDMGVEPFLVQSSVVLAASQRLLKRVCVHCKQPVDVPEDILKRSQYKAFDYIEKPTFVKAMGCDKCGQTGYKKRVAVVEAMLNGPELKPLVLQRCTSHEIKEMAVKCGMKTLRQNALAKAAKGLTTIDQVLKNTVPD